MKTVASRLLTPFSQAAKRLKSKTRALLGVQKKRGKKNRPRKDPKAVKKLPAPAKRLKFSRNPKRRREQKQTEKRMAKAYFSVRRDPSKLEHWATFKNMAIIVGAMKSGTTSLHYCLAQHPALATNLKTKEPSFFTRWKDGDPARLAHYYAQYKFEPEKHKYALEGSTNYTKFPHHTSPYAAMRKTGLNFKFIYILRDPLDRLESHIKHSMTQDRFKDGDDPVTGVYLDTSRYAMQLDQLVKEFGRESVLVISFELFVKNPQGVLDQITDFLDIPRFVPPMIEPRNVRKLKGGVTWTLSKEAEVKAHGLLKPDLEKLSSHYGVETHAWFTRVKKLSQ